MACTKRRKKNIEQRSLLKPELKQVCWNLQKHQTPVELRALSIKKTKSLEVFPRSFFFFFKDSERFLALKPPLCSHNPPKEAGAKSAAVWLFPWQPPGEQTGLESTAGTCDSLHMLRQHTLSDNRRLTPSHFFFFLSFFSNLQVHSVVTKRRCLVSLESRQADDQSASPSVCHPVYLPAWHTHTQTHACT